MATVPAETTTLPGEIDVADPPFRRWPRSRKADMMVAITEHLEGMTRAAGYEYDLSPFYTDAGRRTRRVYRGRAVFGDSDPVPCLSILEGPVPDESPRVANTEESVRALAWVLFIQGWSYDNKDNPTDPCYAFLACVEKRLSELVSKRRSGLPTNPTAFMLNGRIASCSIGPGVVRPPQDGVSSRAFFYLPVVLHIAEDVTQPFVAQ